MIPQDYNSDREKLLFPEYGRHIQNMVKGLSTIEDIGERTRQAHIVIGVMGNLNNNLRDTSDFKHKLWDHLFLLSEFKLDVDSPYAVPTQDDLSPVPQKIKYPKLNFGYKQYGLNIRRVIEEIKDKDTSEIKDDMISDILKFMKFKSYEYNQEFPSNDVVVNHFKSFYSNDIDIDGDILSSAKINVKRKPVNSTLQKKDGARTYRTSSTSSTNSSSTNRNKPRMQSNGAQSNNGQSNNGQSNGGQSNSGTKRYFKHTDNKR